MGVLVGYGAFRKADAPGVDAVALALVVGGNMHDGQLFFVGQVLERFDVSFGDDHYMFFDVVHFPQIVKRDVGNHVDKVVAEDCSFDGFGSTKRAILLLLMG